MNEVVKTSVQTKLLTLRVWSSLLPPSGNIFVYVLKAASTTQLCHLGKLFLLLFLKNPDTSLVVWNGYVGTGRETPQKNYSEAGVWGQDNINKQKK